MSGSFADIPSHRMDLGSDGTIGMYMNANGGQPWVQIPSLAPSQGTDGQTLVNVAGLNFNSMATFLFPEPRTLRGVLWTGDASGGNMSPTFYYSTDTIDGINGTWTSLGSTGYISSAGSALPIITYRSSIAALNLTGVKGVRLACSNSNNNHIYRALHLYGTRPTSSIDRLAFWHPTSDIEISGSYLDWGDIPRGNITASRQFRIKNLSATKTATALSVSSQNMTGSPMGIPGLQVSNDNSTWSSATTPITSLSPGGISNILYARLSTDSTLITQARSAQLITTYGGYA